MIPATTLPMIDPILLARHRNVALPLERSARYDKWTLSGIQPGPVLGLPPALRGDFNTEYEQRASRVTGVAKNAAATDKLRPNHFEAVISRRLGYKAERGEPTHIYWSHMPIARLVHYGSSPHIYISHFHTGGQAQPTRAMLAINPILDYLMTGVRLSVKGVELHRRHEVTRWPKGAYKAGLYIPVEGSIRNPFWTATGFEFVVPRQVGRPGGSRWDDVEAWPLHVDEAETPSALYEPDEVDGLI